MNLVTGATGFVGSYIVRQLVTNGEKVRAIKRAGSSVELLKDLEGKFEWVEGDILDVVSLKEAMKGVKKVFHSAAMISFLNSEVPKMYKVNVEGTANVVNAALNEGVDKLIHISSITALGSYEINHIIDETLKWKEDKDNTHYAISKFRSELEVWRGQEEGLNVLIVNPSTILGYGNWNAGSNLIFKNVYDKIKFYPIGTNAFIGVEDVAKACIALMNSNISGERFILNSENLSYKELFEMIAIHFNLKVPSTPLPTIFATIGWIYFGIKAVLLKQQPVVTKKTIKYTERSYSYSNQKIKEAINFEFTPIEKVVAEACKMYATKN
jgi:dihydroflavonol-4-reductase